jgi:hypothetical protein
MIGKEMRGEERKGEKRREEKKLFMNIVWSISLCAGLACAKSKDHIHPFWSYVSRPHGKIASSNLSLSCLSERRITQGSSELVPRDDVMPSVSFSSIQYLKHLQHLQHLQYLNNIMFPLNSEFKSQQV